MCGRKRAQRNGAGPATCLHNPLAYSSNGNSLIGDMNTSVNKNHHNGLGLPFLSAPPAPLYGAAGGGGGCSCSQRHTCRSEERSRRRSGGPISMLVMLIVGHYEEKRNQRLEAGRGLQQQQRMLLEEERGEWQVEGLVGTGTGLGEKNEDVRGNVYAMRVERKEEGEDEGFENEQQGGPPSYELAVSAR